MSVNIGHARLDENAKVKGGKAGDQTGKEVVSRAWYNGDWITVFRAKNAKVAEKIAKAMEQACANNNIGYDQGQRITLYEQAKKLNWDISKIATKCECDCSSLVSVCINAAGISISKDMYTGNQSALLQGTNKFDTLTEGKYLTKPDNLKRGDILLGPGHTAIVLSDGTSKVATNSSSTVTYKLESAKSLSKALAGTYRATAKLNVRCGAGITKKSIIVIPKGTEVRCYGYYTTVLSTKWLYVQTTCNGKQYTGFISAKYLTKIA